MRAELGSARAPDGVPVAVDGAVDVAIGPEGKGAGEPVGRWRAADVQAASASKRSTPAGPAGSRSLRDATRARYQPVQLAVDGPSAFMPARARSLEEGADDEQEEEGRRDQRCSDQRAGPLVSAALVVPCPSQERRRSQRDEKRSDRSEQQSEIAQPAGRVPRGERQDVHVRRSTPRLVGLEGVRVNTTRSERFAPPRRGTRRASPTGRTASPAGPSDLPVSIAPLCLRRELAQGSRDKSGARRGREERWPPS